MIPKVLHQIWVGEHGIPTDIAQLCQKMHAAHPGWEYKLWTNANYPPDVPANLQPIIDRSREVSRSGRNMGAMEADLLRYLILHNMGGVYLDCDFTLTGTLESLDLSKDLILCAPHPGAHWVGNSAMASAPGQALFASAVAEAKPTHHLYYGPIYLSNILKQLKGLPLGAASSIEQMRSCLNNRETILDRKYFFGKNALIASHIGLGTWLPQNHGLSLI